MTRGEVEWIHLRLKRPNQYCHNRLSRDNSLDKRCNSNSSNAEGIYARIWIVIALGMSALAQEVDIEAFFKVNTASDDVLRTIKGELGSRGLHDCYPSDYEEMYRRCNDVTNTLKKDQPKILQFTEIDDDENEKQKAVCCIPQGFVKPDSNCGERKPDGVVKSGSERKRRDHVRTVLLGEYPWRVLIARIDPEEKPFCAGTVIDAEKKMILTSAGCATVYDKEKIAVTFSRTMLDATTHIPVKDILVHEQYNRNTPFINDIALLVLDTENVAAPSWAMPACLSNRPPMHATVCTTMSPEDHFIDTAIPVRNQCEQNGERLDVSQMCSVTIKEEFVAEVGGGLFCQDQERTQNFNFYASGITLQVRGQLITYTNVSHFNEWIQSKIL